MINYSLLELMNSCLFLLLIVNCSSYSFSESVRDAVGALEERFTRAPPLTPTKLPFTACHSLVEMKIIAEGKIQLPPLHTALLLLLLLCIHHCHPSLSNTPLSFPGICRHFPLESHQHPLLLLLLLHLAPFYTWISPTPANLMLLERGSCY